MEWWLFGISENKGINQFPRTMTKIVRGNTVTVYGRFSGLAKGPKEERVWSVFRVMVGL